MNYTDLSYKVYNFFNQHVGCESYFLGKGIWDSFLRTAEKTKYIDFRGDPNNLAIARAYTFEQVGLTSNRRERGHNIHVQLLGDFAITWLTENTITVGAAWFGSSSDEQDELIVHEVLRVFYKGEHRVVARQLFGLQGVDEDAASDAIDRFLDSDCTAY